MLYIHESNLKTKIASNYGHCGEKIQKFYDTEYLKMRKTVENLSFKKTNKKDFEKATKIFNEYYDLLGEFSAKNGISSQSKFQSTFLEEISVYLFSNLPDVKNGKYGFYNKKIYAGLKIDSDDNVAIIPKDVDFCIGKKVAVKIANQSEIELIIPIVAVEVKTYLDATMFGEVKSSSRAIRSGTPNSKTYVLMGYRSLADEHIIAARQDSYLTEIYVLRKDENSPMDADVIYDYWNDIFDVVKNVSIDNPIITPGKILFPNGNK